MRSGRRRRRKPSASSASSRRAPISPRWRGSTRTARASSRGEISAISSGDAWFPTFEKVAFGLKTGQMSGVVETQFGYHIIKATDHATASTVPFDQAKQNIVQYLTEQKKQQALTTYFDSLRAAVERSDPRFEPRALTSRERDRAIESALPRRALFSCGFAADRPRRAQRRIFSGGRRSGT